MLTPAELAEMRAEVAGAMPSSAAIARRSTTKNALGGRDAAPGAVSGLEAVPCHVHPDTTSTGAESEQRHRLAGEQRYRIVFAHGVDVRSTDVATVDGIAYELVSIDTGRSWALEVEAIAIRAV